jgi:hypothetical protein
MMLKELNSDMAMDSADKGNIIAVQSMNQTIVGLKLPLLGRLPCDADAEDL